MLSQKSTVSLAQRRHDEEKAMWEKDNDAVVNAKMGELLINTRKCQMTKSRVEISINARQHMRVQLRYLVWRNH